MVDRPPLRVTCKIKSRRSEKYGALAKCVLFFLSDSALLICGHKTGKIWVPCNAEKLRIHRERDELPEQFVRLWTSQNLQRVLFHPLDCALWAINLLRFQ
jgi:hypothetical protein